MPPGIPDGRRALSAYQNLMVGNGSAAELTRAMSRPAMSGGRKTDPGKKRTPKRRGRNRR